MFGDKTHRKLGIWCIYLFVEFIAGSKCILNGVLVVRAVEIEKVHTVRLQPLKGGFIKM